jgi:hypothetical protein
MTAAVPLARRTLMHHRQRFVAALGGVMFAVVLLNMTIGTRTIIFPNVKIGAGATVGACSVVYSNTLIGPGELWLGNPAVKQAPLGHSAPDAVVPPFVSPGRAVCAGGAEVQCVGARN